MHKNVILSSILCGLCLAPFAASANDKSQGAPVSFAYRGIIWNGTCEPQFFASGKNAMIKGDEAELYSACESDAGVKSVTIDGMEVKGKCALGFEPPRPK